MTADHDPELDALLHAARARFLSRSDAAFDFDAGLADVCERAAIADARDALGEAEQRPRAEDQAEPLPRAEDQAEQRRRARRQRAEGGQPGHRSAGGD